MNETGKYSSSRSARTRAANRTSKRRSEDLAEIFIIFSDELGILLIFSSILHIIKPFLSPTQDLRR